MINVGLYYRVKPGHEQDFEKSFEGVVTFLKGHVEGFRDAKLYRSVNDPQEYMIYSEWDSIETFKKFMLSRQFSDTTQYGKTILEGIPRHRIFKEVNEE
ncbi:antibiotic biosynthesis monooxygenase family protein [Acidianus manzaensis]|uniref:Antibiotic biosynthesis monooxygenase n=1 Tax=Acidianus manzaensis TaxID=282676 RepID=A0A1W6K342_9CREN|nr:antibiotic biosynthesis monooxygenase [Acidianus manzaensis]ARM76905.1 antibiotic biosynthesis monooxygenase [Acidianus manzaensis]